MFLRAFTLLFVAGLTLWNLSYSASAETLFFDDFDDGVISKAYIFKAGQNLKWVEENGVLVQKNKLAGDPVYAIIADKEYPKALTIEAKLRVDEWETGPCARTGVAVRVSKDTGEGLAFLFSDHRVAKPQTGVAFLDDHVAWAGSTQNGVKMHPKKLSTMKTGKRENGKTRQGVTSSLVK